MFETFYLNIKETMSAVKETLENHKLMKFLSLGVLAWAGALFFFPVAIFVYVGLVFLGFNGAIEGLAGHFFVVGTLLSAVVIFNVPFVLVPYTQKGNHLFCLLFFHFGWLYLTALSREKRKKCLAAWRKAPQYLLFDWADGLCMLFSALAIGLIVWFFPPVFSTPARNFEFPFVWLAAICYIQFPFLYRKAHLMPGETLQDACEQRIYPFLLLHGMFNTMLLLVVLLGYNQSTARTFPNFIGFVGLAVLYEIYFVISSTTSIVLWMCLLGAVKLASLLRQNVLKMFTKGG